MTTATDLITDSTIVAESQELKKGIKELQSVITDKDGVKHIFVLNVNAANHTHSIQESKAMTPCFLHTPNMTNKWNDFKPQDGLLEGTTSTQK